MTTEDLLYSLVQLFEHLEIPYFITGSVAAMTYGESRFTSDVDIVAVLRDEHVAPFCAAFPPPNYYLSADAMRSAIRDHRQFNVLHITEGVKADIMVPRTSDFNQSRLARCRPERVGSRGVAMVASPEDVMLKKMEYYKEGQSEKHLRDIIGMLRICPYPVDHAYVSNWAAKLDVLDIWQMILDRLRAPSTGDASTDNQQESQ